MYWIFDDETLLLSCRQRACTASYDETDSTSPMNDKPSHKRARQFACGFQQKQQQSNDGASSSSTFSSSTPQVQQQQQQQVLSPDDQETIVHFHAHQLQQLVGPNAIFEQLRRSSQVLSTAIVLLRRFYLSNSVIEFHPRHIAAAAALLAVKVDCEPNLPVSS